MVSHKIDSHILWAYRVSVCVCMWICHYICFWTVFHFHWLHVALHGLFCLYLACCMNTHLTLLKSCLILNEHCKHGFYEIMSIIKPWLCAICPFLNLQFLKPHHETWCTRVCSFPTQSLWSLFHCIWVSIILAVSIFFVNICLILGAYICYSCPLPTNVLKTFIL